MKFGKGVILVDADTEIEIVDINGNVLVQVQVNYEIADNKLIIRLDV